MKKNIPAKISKPFDKTGRQRVVIENVTPLVERGLYPAKRVINEWVPVEADVFTDGHDEVASMLMYRKKGSRKWNETRMEPLGNDRFRGYFHLNEQGYYEFTVRGFIDHTSSWLHSYRKRIQENDTRELEVQVQILEQFLEQIRQHYPKSKTAIGKITKKLQSEERFTFAGSEETETLLKQYLLEKHTTTFDLTPEIVAHRKRAGFSAWYSFFPRSSAPAGKEHGTFKDCEKILPRIREMGFDVVYFPPIHPIGHQFRKGKNNSLNIQPGEPGCPYATGNELGGHKGVLPELGTLDDFRRLIKKTEELDMEIAMDFAIQCSPDHPYVKEHPQWFKWRPDGTVQYAENPPKKYQDVLPLDFENEDWQNMWVELKSILEYWIQQGIRIFRIDNPHTKSFVFWQWCLGEIEKEHPDVIFLSEAFTRPRIMENLAKKGFHQSYTYFTWRNTKHELMQYMRELTQSPMSDYFRPNFWPNTHDINPYITQSGYEPQFILRYFLAAALSSNYGIFGPSYELMVHAAIPGKEEYLDSEKYEVRHWDWNLRNKLMHVISLVNKIRNTNEAMQFTGNYTECHIEHDQMMAWLKVYGENKILCIANLDVYNRQSSIIHIPLDKIGKTEGQQYTVHDLVTGEKYRWTGSSNYVDLDPNKLPFHLFRIEDH